VVCLLSLGEGPWAGLQFVAWSKMVWERSSEMGLLAAVADVAYREGSIYHAASGREIFLAALGILLAALIFWRHRENIARLLAGAEPRIGAGRKPGS